MIELQYESKFDGFLVDLRIGPAFLGMMAEGHAEG